MPRFNLQSLIPLQPARKNVFDMPIRYSLSKW